ncbi:MAG: replication initiator protein [Microviridae sp.]|nr:MAG: replication initiator protein [Microviridae sp.]
MCLYPKLIRNKKFEPNKKNRGNVVKPTDPRVLYVPIGCQKCEECKKQIARGWRVRLNEEIKTNEATFITLTFNEESLVKLQTETGAETPRENIIATTAVRKFLERYRYKYRTSVKHWLTTELGSKNNKHKGTERIHLHGFIFKKINNEELTKIWGYGYTHTGTYVNERTVNYVIKYVTKTDPEHPNYINKILCSKGIGKRYIKSWNAEQNRYKIEETRETYKTPGGLEISLPIYYRNKIYTDEERQRLWIEKLNKNERYILGRKYITKTTEQMKIYLEDLKHFQKENSQKGYGNRDWKTEKYEEEINKIKNHRPD